MLILMWGFFVVLNGKLTWEIALLGAAAAAAAFAFSCAFLDWSPARELRLLKRFPALARYALGLFADIVKANLATLRQVYGRRAPESAVVTLRPALKRPWQRQLLANSITLTPGTLTMECDEDRLVVHCLDASMAEGLEDSPAERAIVRMGEKP